MGFTDVLYGFFIGKELSVPMGQIIIFVVVNSLFLLYERHRAALLLSYGFVFFWGFVFNYTYFRDLLGGSTVGLQVYTFFGVFILILVAIGFILEDRD